MTGVLQIASLKWHISGSTKIRYWLIIHRWFAESSIIEESEDRSQSQDVHYSASSNVSDAQHASEASDLVSSTLNKDFKDRVFVAESELSAEKHSISMEVKYEPFYLEIVPSACMMVNLSQQSSVMLMIWVY